MHCFVSTAEELWFITALFLFHEAQIKVWKDSIVENNWNWGRIIGLRRSHCFVRGTKSLLICGHGWPVVDPRLTDWWRRQTDYFLSAKYLSLSLLEITDLNLWGGKKNWISKTIYLGFSIFFFDIIKNSSLSPLEG